MSMPLLLPARVIVKKNITQRYPANLLPRPESWDLRSPGIDQVELENGLVLNLKSSGGQSVPQPGWVLMLTSGSEETGYDWTLYGFSRSQSLKNV